jgi:MFS transporter, OFA family, oxalate/formate antiporter
MSSEFAVRARQGLLVLGAALGLGCGFPGLFFSTSPLFLKPLASDFQWDRASTSAVSMAAMLGLTIAGPLVGWLMDRIGPGRVMVCSIILFAVCIFTLSILPNSLVLFATVSFAVGSLGAGTGPIGYSFALSRNFDRRLGLALSIVMVGGGLGSVIFPLLTQSVMQSGDWRAAYRVLAAAALLGGGIAITLVSVAAAPAASVNQPATLPLPGYSIQAALRQRSFWTLFTVAAVVAMSCLGTTVHLPALLSDAGIAGDRVAQILAGIGAGIMLGRLLSGVLLDVMFAPLLGALALLPGAVALVIFGFHLATSFPLQVMSALLLGFSVGTEADFLAFVTRRYFGLQSFGLIYGALFCAYTLAGVFGPILFGLAYDHSASYDLPLRLGAAGLVVAALALLSLGPYRYAAARS